MTDPVISVVVASFNHARFVGEAIKSVLDQSFADWELVITDDGSPDESVAVIQSFKDRRIHLHAFERNHGACVAINHAIRRARGRHIAVLNSDDVFLPHKLETQLDYLENHPGIMALFSWAEIIDETGQPVTPGSHYYTQIFDQENRSRRDWARELFLRGNCFCHPSVLIRASAYRELGLYDERLAQLPDFDMWVRLCLRHEIAVLPTRLVRFRVSRTEANASSRSLEAQARMIFECRHVLNHYLGIRDPAEFASIFFPQVPDAASRLEPRALAFELAMIAASSGLVPQRQFAAATLFQQMQGEQASYLEQRYGFTPKDLHRITGCTDGNEMLQANYEQQLAAWQIARTNLEREVERLKCQNAEITRTPGWLRRLFGRIQA